MEKVFITNNSHPALFGCVHKMAFDVKNTCDAYAIFGRWKKRLPDLETAARNLQPHERDIVVQGTDNHSATRYFSLVSRNKDAALVGKFLDAMMERWGY